MKLYNYARALLFGIASAVFLVIMKIWVSIRFVGWIFRRRT